MGELFSDSELDEVARQTQFKIRKSKLTPSRFVDVVLFKEMDNATTSLEDHCIALKQRYGVDLHKQSLNERFDGSAVEFIRELLSRQLSNQVSSAIEKGQLGNILQQFSSVKIKDSTRFQIPECLKEYYPGSTGAASGAGVHIQFEFDILNARVNDLRVTDALQQDVTDAYIQMDAIEKGSLVIRDLGYFSTRILEHIEKEQAYYITRTKNRMNLIGANGQEIQLEAVYRKMKRTNLPYMELPVIIGNNKLPSRLIIEMLPEKEVDKRLAKATKEARKKGRSLSKEYKFRARLNLFITNVPSKWIATAQVRKIYQIRWQIELRFKAWKSLYNIDKVKKMQRHRFECYLYTTLLMIIITLEIASGFFAIIWKHTAKPLSLFKFYKTTAQNTATLRQAILGEGNLMHYLSFLYEISYTKLLTEKRKNHQGSLVEILSEDVLV